MASTFTLWDRALNLKVGVLILFLAVQYWQNISLVFFVLFCFNRVSFYSSGWSGTLSDSEMVGLKVWNHHIQLNVFIWVHMYICLGGSRVYGYTHVHVYGGPILTLCVFLGHCSLFWLRRGLLLTPELTYSSSLASQFALGILSMPPGCKHFIYWAILQALNLRCLMSL